MAKKRIATFLAPNKGLSVAGDHAYAYSGAIALDNTTNENTYLLFTIGNYYFVGTMLANNLDEGDASDDMVYAIYFNGQQVQGYRAYHPYTEPDNVVPLIIPPNTEVKITCRDLTQASTIKNIVSLAGRVYDA